MHRGEHPRRRRRRAAVTARRRDRVPHAGVSAVGVCSPSLLPSHAAARCPAVRALARRLTGRDVAGPRFRSGRSVIAFVGCAIAWVLYGVAFQLLVDGAIRPARLARSSAYIAVFTAVVLVGYLFLSRPGGSAYARSRIGAIAAAARAGDRRAAHRDRRRLPRSGSPCSNSSRLDPARGYAARAPTRNHRHDSQ